MTIIIISAVRCSLPYPEEQEGPAKGHSFRPIKALTWTPTGKMDPGKADAVIKSERGGQRGIRCGFSSFCQRWTVSSG